MEIIQPWQLYLILQADNIGRVMGEVANSFLIVSIPAMCISLAVSFISSFDRPSPVAGLWKKKWWVIVLVGTLAAMLHIITALIPSTKTAAIMFGVPAVINNPTFQHETGEVYQLLKKALADTVNKPEPKPEKKE